MMTPLVIAAAALVPLSLIALVWSLAGERSAKGSRSGAVDLRTQELSRGVGARAISPTVRWLSVRARRFTPIGLVEGMDRRIKMAGWTDRMPLERALALKSLTFAIGIALGAFLFIGSDARLTGVAVIVGSYFVLDLILWGRARERQQLIEHALPDSMDQLKISVEAGLGLEAAMERISRGHGPLAEEFGRVVSEIQLGLSRRDAMQSMITRTDVPELRRFVSAMTHAEAFGVPMAQVLKAQAEDLRDKRRMRAQEKAQRIPVQIIFPLIVFIFPVIFIVLLGPAAINIYEQLFPAL